MTICPYEGTECDFTCPYCHHPIKEADMEHPCAGATGCIPRESGTGEEDMTTQEPAKHDIKKVILLLGCPEVPVQMAIALYMAYNLQKRGSEVLVTGNPSVLNLLRVSDS